MWEQELRQSRALPWHPINPAYDLQERSLHHHYKCSWRILRCILLHWNPSVLLSFHAVFNQVCTLQTLVLAWNPRFQIPDTKSVHCTCSWSRRTLAFFNLKSLHSHWFSLVSCPIYNSSTSTLAKNVVFIFTAFQFAIFQEQSAK